MCGERVYHNLKLYPGGFVGYDARALFPGELTERPKVLAC